jgi:hypothetical protein
VSQGEVGGEDVYRAVLRLAYRDGTVGGEEMDWLRRMAELLEIEKDARKEIQKDIRYQSRMEQLEDIDDEPADVFRDVCERAWKNDQLGPDEVEAIEDLARAFGFARARAEGILAGTAPAGAAVPDLANMEGEGLPASTGPAPSSPAKEGATEASAEASANAKAATPEAEGGGFPVVETLVVLAVLGGVAAIFVL